MKYITTIISVIAFVIVAQSCKKDSAEFDNKTGTNTQAMLRTTADSLLQLKIFNFITRMNLVRDDPDYEGSENWNYSEDSTLWYFEAALNYSLNYEYRYYDGEEEERHYTSIIDSTDAEIEDDDGSYNIIEIQEAYDSFIEDLVDFYNAIEDDDKCFILIDIEEEIEDNIQGKFVFGTFDEDRSIYPWYWGWALGDCYGTYVGIDAADILEYYANDFYGVNYTQASQFSYYTNIVATTYIQPNDVPTTPHQFGNYMLFEDYQEGTLNHHCMGAAEMDVFFDFLPIIAANNQPAGKSTVHYNVRDNTAFGVTYPSQLNYWYMIHETRIKYGIHHVGSQSPPTP